MVNMRELDPGASPLAYFGSELRRLRQEVGQTQEETGRLVFLTGSQIGQFETAVLMPKREQVELLDQAVGAGGALLRTWPLISRSALPQWFQKQANVERRATEIYSWHTHLVHGLLQTEEYARAVLAAMHSQGLDARVAARLERQEMLRRADPPVVWAVISEAVLHQEIGGKEVMRRQLGHLVGFRENDLVNVQVLPFAAGVHAGLPGPFTLLRFGDMPDVAYEEGFDGGTGTVDPAKVRDRALRYDHLQAAALSIEDSAALIARVMEERYGEESGDEA
jgi:transcriptional regulator with XRE-family HTH domain